MKTKLTPAQLRVLRELCKPNARVMLRPTMGKWKWIFNGKDITRQVNALIKLFLLEKKNFYSYATPAAHALLAELDKETTK